MIKFAGLAVDRAEISAQAKLDRAGQPGGKGYLASRFVANIAKAAGFTLLAGVNAGLFRSGAAKKALVRAWRSCGYVYQVPRSLLGKI